MTVWRIDWDASEVGDLAKDLTKVWARMYPALVRDTEKSTQQFQEHWRKRAKATSGKHGWKFPLSIRGDADGLEATIKTTPGMDQAGMARSFEWGTPSRLSVVRPGQYARGARVGGPVGQLRPHLSMTHTADADFPVIYARWKATVERTCRL